jgi:hypothetical protein
MLIAEFVLKQGQIRYCTCGFIPETGIKIKDK